MIKREIIEDLKKNVEKIKNEKELFQEKNIFTKKFISPLYSSLKDLTDLKKKEFGKNINILKEEIDDIFNFRLECIKDEYINSLKSEFDPLIKFDDNLIGGMNPLEKSINEISSFFNSLNFKIDNGDEIVSSKYNFDKLNMDENHLAREENDTFFINKDILLRTHCTSSSAKIIENNKNQEIKVISYGNVYRKDDDDATHSHQFNQVDLIWIKKDLNIANLKWLISSFLKYFFKNNDIKIKYRLSYFPFTEPSFEVDISCFKCESKGCSICKRSGWIEVLGSGIFNPKVIHSANISKDMVGLAAGIGIDRLTMIKYGITDIRNLYNNDFRVLNKFRGGK